MAKSIRDNKKRRGRPRTTGTGTLIGVRMTDDSLSTLDGWAAKQDDTPSRPEAIRRLVDLGLMHARPASRHNPTKGAEARQLAAKTIAGLTDPSASPEEQATRKRRLTKGPPEFRDMRADVPKRKG
jgi:hypothetical protein